MHSKYNFLKLCRDGIYMLMCVMLMYSYKCVGPKPENMVMGIFFGSIVEYDTQTLPTKNNFNRKWNLITIFQVNFLSTTKQVMIFFNRKNTQNFSISPPIEIVPPF